MTTLRTLIADDEPLARELLRHLLAAHPDIEIVAEAGDGEAALALLLRHKPDLALLDIRMPERDGFEVLASLPPDFVPAIVFVTAYDRYALQAFEVAAVDYLLKPYDEERLAMALGRVRERLTCKERGYDLEQLLARLADGGATRRINRLFLDLGKRIVPQPVAEIRWLEAAGKNVRVHATPCAHSNGTHGLSTHTVRDTLTRLGTLLDPARFVRISRSAIVNLDRVVEVQTWFHGDFLVVLDTGARVPSTRGYRESLTQALQR